MFLAAHCGPPFACRPAPRRPAARLGGVHGVRFLTGKLAGGFPAATATHPRLLPPLRACQLLPGILFSSCMHVSEFPAHIISCAGQHRIVGAARLARAARSSGVATQAVSAPEVRTAIAAGWFPAAFVFPT